MNRFLLITKVQLLNVFKQSNKKKSMLNLGSYTIGAIVMAGVGIYYSVLLFSGIPPEAYNSVPFFMVYMITFLVFIMGISTSRGMLFGFKDLDMLKAMPFTEREIVFSKIAVFTLTEYAYAGSFFLPVILIFGIKAGMSWMFYVLALIGYIALPLLPISLSSLIGMGLEKISAGRKHSELIKNVLGVVFFVAIYAVSMYAGFSSSSSQGSAFLGMNQYFEKVMILSKWYMEGAINNNVLLVLASMAVSIAVYIAFLYFYSGTVMKINARSNQGYHVTNFQVKKEKMNSVFKAVFIKERERFFKNFLYVFNTAFGMLVLMGGSIYLAFNKSFMIEVAGEVLRANSDMYALVSQIFILGIIFFGQLSCTTSSSISLEGKSLWIMKSLPVTVKQIFWAKMLVNILIIMIPSTISLIMLGLVFGFGLDYYLLGLVFISASALGISMFGLLVNLHFPKLEFENEQEVIKQSMAAFIGAMVPMFGGMGMIILFFASGASISFMFYIFIIVYIVIDIFLYIILMDDGKRKFESLI